MNNFFTGTYDFLYLIAQKIDESQTWCRFSQTCKRADLICKKLLTEHECKNNHNAVETYATMPNGHKHGLAKKYITSWFNTSSRSQTGSGYYYKNNKRLVLPVDWWEVR